MAHFSDPVSISRKRKASNANNNNAESGDSTHDHHSVLPDDDSVEGMLAVPMPIIFRQVPASQKPLLSRAEAKCFLQITMLAQEIDVLTAVSSNALSQRMWCRQFAHKLSLLQKNSHTCCGNPFLRPLLPLLDIQGSMIPNSALNGMEHELNRVLTELEHCGVSLRQFSEQNWTLSESLLETLGEDFDEDYYYENNGIAESDLPKGAVLAREKRRLSDLQEEVSNRIESLLGQGQEHSEGAGEPRGDDNMEQEHSEESQGGGGDRNYDSTVTLSQLCASLWNSSKSREVSNAKHSSNTESKTTTYHHKNNRLRCEDGQEGLFSYPDTIQGLDKQMMEESSKTEAVDALQALQQQRQIQASSSATANTSSRKQDDSQRSTHSVVSNNSADNHDKDAIPIYVNAPTTTKTATSYTESQVQRQDASEALAALAEFG